MKLECIYAIKVELLIKLNYLKLRKTGKVCKRQYDKNH